MGLPSTVLVFLLFYGVPAWAIYYVVLLFRDKAKSAAIHEAFQKARDLRGKTFEEIIVIGGEPLQCFNYPEGKQVAIFGHTHFKVVLVFRNGLCEGVIREIPD